jgi:hypothetical protein
MRAFQRRRFQSVYEARWRSLPLASKSLTCESPPLNPQARALSKVGASRGSSLQRSLLTCPACSGELVRLNAGYGRKGRSFFNPCPAFLLT